MITLEQVKVLETKVAKAIEYVEHVNAEKAASQSREAELLSKLEACQTRIDEFEALISRFKADHSLLEDGLLSMADRVNQLDEALEKSMAKKKTEDGPKSHKAHAPKASPKAGLSAKGAHLSEAEGAHPGGGPPEEMFFEIPEEDSDGDFEDHGGEGEDSGEPNKQGKELEIY